MRENCAVGTHGRDQGNHTNDQEKSTALVKSRFSRERSQGVSDLLRCLPRR
jgi:hypothetical protein